MSLPNWSGYGGKRLDFSAFKSAGKTEYLIAGVLGLVILFAGYMVIKQVWGGSTGGIKPPDFFMFKCEKCGNEFKKKVSELPTPQHYSDEMDTMKLDCPKCGTAKSSWREIECPACKQYFVPQSQKAHWEALKRGRPDMENVRDVCTNPDCKTDISKWYMDHRNKK